MTTRRRNCEHAIPHRHRAHAVHASWLNQVEAQANAKLVFRTVLTIDGPEGARHCVPLKRRKSVNPLVRRGGV